MRKHNQGKQGLLGPSDWKQPAQPEGSTARGAGVASGAPRLLVRWQRANHPEWDQHQLCGNSDTSNEAFAGLWEPPASALLRESGSFLAPEGRPPAEEGS